MGRHNLGELGSTEAGEVPLGKALRAMCQWGSDVFVFTMAQVLPQ